MIWRTEAIYLRNIFSIFRVEGAVHEARAGVVTAAGDGGGETSWTPRQGIFQSVSRFKASTNSVSKLDWY